MFVLKLQLYQKEEKNCNENFSNEIAKKGTDRLGSQSALIISVAGDLME